MNRKKFLCGALLLLAIINVAWHLYSNWGLITVHAKKQPLTDIIRSIERQGRVTLKTNIDPALKVSMNVDKVPLTEALETLAANTDSRWRLAYVFAPAESQIAGRLDDFQAGKNSDGWKELAFPVPQLTFTESAPADPRRDFWTVVSPIESTLQAHLQQAAEISNATFLFPENWNPLLKSSLRSGRVGKVVPKLASVSGSEVTELFLLQKRQWRSRVAKGGAREDETSGAPSDGDPTDRAITGRRRNFEQINQRIQRQIDNLPPEQQAVAKAQFDAERKFRESLRGLSQEERQQKMSDHFNDPAVQAQAQKRADQQDNRTSPEKKIQRYDSYANRRSTLKSAQTSQ